MAGLLVLAACQKDPDVQAHGATVLRARLSSKSAATAVGGNTRRVGIEPPAPLPSEASILAVVAADNEPARIRLRALRNALHVEKEALSQEAQLRMEDQLFSALHARAAEISGMVGHPILDAQERIEDPATVLQQIKRAIARRVAMEGQQQALRGLLGSQAGTAVFRADLALVDKVNGAQTPN